MNWINRKVCHFPNIYTHFLSNCICDHHRQRQTTTMKSFHASSVYSATGSRVFFFYLTRGFSSFIIYFIFFLCYYYLRTSSSQWWVTTVNNLHLDWKKLCVKRRIKEIKWMDVKNCMILCSKLQTNDKKSFFIHLFLFSKLI